ncbi:hypothetical protein Tco_0459930 [Tanacetum coccineum]
MMITTTSRIEDKNLLGLILPKDTMETFLCVQNAPCITQEIALSSVELATKKRIGKETKRSKNDQKPTRNGKETKSQEQEFNNKKLDSRRDFNLHLSPCTLHQQQQPMLLFVQNRSLNDKILVPEPDSSPCCAKCGTPVDGPYCRGCALLRKKFEEDLLTYCVENGIFQDSQDTFESSDDNTNVINALQEPIVVNQDPGVKSSQGPPLINQNCCYECGDSLDGIFCQQCICKFCGKGAHYGYNCPPKVPIISNPEQCNQTINELPKTLPSVHPTFNYEDENSFTYDSKPNSFNDSPSVLTHPPQLQFETYLCELCGNNAHYGYDCPPQFPFVYEQEPCYNQNFNDNYFPQNSQSSSQQYLCCENCGGPHENFQCQPMYEDYYEQNSCYDPNSFGFDQYQPPQFPVNYPPQETSREILQAREDLMETIQAFLKEYDHIPPNEKCMALLLAEERFLKIKQVMREEQNQPEVMQELLLKLMDDLYMTVKTGHTL